MAQPVQRINPGKEERSLGDLFAELANDTSKLVRAEVALAQAEITQKATRVGTQVGYLVVGGAVGYAALLVVLAAVTLGLTILIQSISGWSATASGGIAAALVGIVVGIVAYSLITSALAKLRSTDLTPRQTIETVKEDAQWLKNQMS